jgi:hypothetical protein
MTRSKSAEPRVRLNLELAQRSRVRLEELVHRSDAANMHEVVDRVSEAWEAILVTQAAGGRVLVRQQDGSERELLFR